MKIGEQVVFGPFTWRILDIRNHQMLLLTETIIDQRDFHDKKEDVTWEQSAIRRFLNTDFYNQFSYQEKERIIPVLNKNISNHWYQTDAGADTLDEIFLLSMDEVVRYYFGDSGFLLDYPKKNQRYWFDRKDENNVKRRTSYLNYIWWWWTRTPGKNQKVAVYIHGDGNIGIQGNGICKTTFKGIHPVTKSNCGGIRPALWLKYE